MTGPGKGGLPPLDAPPLPVPVGEWARVRARARARQRSRHVAVSAAVLLVAAVPLAAVALGSTSTRANDSLNQAAPSDGIEVFPNADLSRDHVMGPVDYPRTPPVGGAHDPVPQMCAVYRDPIRNEHAVHSLEHGAVWITYRPDLVDPDGVTALTQTIKRADHYGLMSPLPEQAAPVIATAWGRQLVAQDPADPRLATFVDRFANGPQTPEPGTACVGTEATRSP